MAKLIYDLMPDKWVYHKTSDKNGKFVEQRLIHSQGKIPAVSHKYISWHLSEIQKMSSQGNAGSMTSLPMLRI